MVNLYPKLARQNIHRGKQLYLPYLLTLMVTAAAFYVAVALSQPEVWPADSIRYAYLSMFMSIGTFVVAVFAVVFLTYTGRFLAKGRQQELGLYNVLGMGKGHIGLVLGFESMFLGVLGIVGGIALGVALQALLGRLLSVLMGLPPFGAGFSAAAAASTAVLFAMILAFNLFLDLLRVRAQKPAELLREGSVGEREPKARWLLALLGFAALGAGYFIALTTKSALDAMVVYFLAVLFVVIGTYCLFTAGSVVILKALRKNKAYYYQIPHFIGLSGMIHRMKRNGVGLANICILCTMVLVMISGTLGLYLGVRRSVNEVFPREAAMTVGYDPLAETPLDKDALKTALTASMTDKGYAPQMGGETEYLSSASFRVLEDGAYVDSAARPEQFVNTALFTFFDYDAYDRAMGRGAVPRDGKAHVYTTGKLPDSSALTLGIGPDAVPWTVELGESLAAAPKVTTALVYVSDFEYTVVLPRETLLELMAARPAGDYSDWKLTWKTFWDLGGDVNAQQDDLQAAMDTLVQVEAGEYLSLGGESRAHYAAEYYAMNGGFLFLGVFLGTLFLLATLLILYYKQLSEGREDRSRFQIMKKVGLDETDIRRSVNSQMGTVFFAPLLVAGIHVAFDFPIITRLFTLFGLYDLGLELVCTLAVFAVFALLYAGMYRLTTRGYCRMVG